MKKVLISLLILAFLAPLTIVTAQTITPAATVDSNTASAQLTENIATPALTSSVTAPAPKATVLEKILSPEQIKYFRVMKKEGNALYGIRVDKANKSASETKAELSGQATPLAQPSVKALEKISGPWEVELYEKIRKVGNALWGYKKPVEEGLGVSNLSPEIIACFKKAIDKKDESIKTTISTASTELSKAVDERNTCQKNALDLNDKQATIKAFKVCRDNFNKAVKDSRLSAKKARDAAWKTYHQEIKTCTATAVSDTTATEGLVEEGNVLLDDGGNNLDL